MGEGALPTLDKKAIYLSYQLKIRSIKQAAAAKQQTLLDQQVQAVGINRPATVPTLQPMLEAHPCFPAEKQD